LRTVLEATPRDSLTFLGTEHGKPSSPAGFSNLSREWCYGESTRQNVYHESRTSRRLNVYSVPVVVVFAFARGDVSPIAGGRSWALYELSSYRMAALMGIGCRLRALYELSGYWMAALMDIGCVCRGCRESEGDNYNHGSERAVHCCLPVNSRVAAWTAWEPQDYNTASKVNTSPSRNGY
jgi:hypothetical protein